MRNTLHFSINNLTEFKRSAIAWGRKFQHFSLLDSNFIETTKTHNLNSSFDILIGAGHADNSTINELQANKLFQPDWYFGHITYDYKEDTCKIESHNKNTDGFLKYQFFRPLWVIAITGTRGILHFPYSVSANIAKQELEILLALKLEEEIIASIPKIKCSINKNEYFKAIEQIKKHIARGDIYEMNYCINFGTQNATLDPYYFFEHTNNNSPAPFAAFYKNNTSYLLCSSPERFLKKNGQILLSQPIKGTAIRSFNPAIDEKNIATLINNPKEHAENVMIVDLVRNDLSRIAEFNSVKVDELCKLYSFKHVHQLISTISAKIGSEYQFWDIMQALFPMGSMTGAPKINAVRYAETFENFRRGLYSGTVGYIDPHGNFDFNVVIRSILFNKSTGSISIPAGSAITNNCNAEHEYNECVLKVAPLINALRKQHIA